MIDLRTVVFSAVVAVVVVAAAAAVLAAVMVVVVVVAVVQRGVGFVDFVVQVESVKEPGLGLEWLSGS